MPPVKDRGQFSPDIVSANRVNSYTTCGVAFEREYIQNIPQTRSGAAALFGSVMHTALEQWSLDRKANSLVDMIPSAWLLNTRDDVSYDFVKAFSEMAPEVEKAEQECIAAFEKRTGKQSKAIRMSGEWKRHPVSKKLDKFLAQWNDKLTKSYYRFGEWDPLPGLYTQSFALARKYEERMGDAPNSWAVEQGFTVPFGQGFMLNGYIDSIEPVQFQGRTAIGVKDYKTYAKEPTEYKDWRQRVIYFLAVAYLSQHTWPNLSDSPVPHDVLASNPEILVGMDYIRWDKSWEKTDPIMWYQVSKQDIDELSIELAMYRDGIRAGIFLPAEKGRNPDFCGYGDECCLVKRAGEKSRRVVVDS